MISRRFILASLAAAIATAACPTPRPSPSDPTRVSGWADTARLVLTTIEWAVPAARAIVSVAVPEPARAIVDRALSALAEAAGGLRDALATYEARGAEQCLAHASVGGIRSALVTLARVLADAGLALGVTFERLADSVGSIADALAPRCDGDAGWSSAGESVNRELSAIARSASARGVILRRDLDAMRPPTRQ